MADAFIPVLDGSGSQVAKLQSYRNTIDGQIVDSEAITPTTDTGEPIKAGIQAEGSTSSVPPTVVNPFIGEWDRSDYYQFSRVTMACDQPGVLFFDFYDLDGSTPTAGTSPTSTYPVAGFRYDNAPFNFYHGAEKGLRWFRARFVPDADASTFRINAYFLSSADSFIPLSQSLSKSQDAQVVRSFGAGITPNGDPVDTPASGPYTFSSVQVPLGAGGSWQSEVIDIRRHPSMSIIINADQASAVNGVVYEWSDTEAFTVVRSSRQETFRSGNIASGVWQELKARFSFFRIRYVNGSNPQTSFYIGLFLVNAPISRVVEILPANSGSTGQMDVGTTAEKVPLTLAGRTGVRLKNMTSSARPLFYGFSLGLTVANGDELAAGEAVELDLSVSSDLYVIAFSTQGAGVRCSWAEVA